MRRRIGRDVFHRWEGNPILGAEDVPYRCNTVFNGTVAKVGSEYLLLLRIEGQQGYSFFGLARSPDGFHFEVEEHPVLFPAREGEFCIYESMGIEDPRATFIEDSYLVAYTAYSGYGTRIAIARTQDFRRFERLALSSGPGNKDGVLFPERIDGKYVRLDRPIGLDVGSIWISYSQDLHSWGHSRVLLTPRPGYWDSYRVGASIPPIRTARGWLEIYHGTQMTASGPIYRAGAALLDLDDPSRVIARCSVPLLSPREDYERIGDVGNVVFPCGAIVEDGEIRMYYGAADTYLCVATASLDDVIRCALDEAGGD